MLNTKLLVLVLLCFSPASYGRVNGGLHRRKLVDGSGNDQRRRRLSMSGMSMSGMGMSMSGSNSTSISNSTSVSRSGSKGGSMSGSKGGSKGGSMSMSKGSTTGSPTFVPTMAPTVDSNSTTAPTVPGATTAPTVPGATTAPTVPGATTAPTVPAVTSAPTNATDTNTTATEAETARTAVIDLLAGNDETATDATTRTLPIRSTLNLGFFDGKGRQPTDEEVASLVQETVKFFTQVFQGNADFAGIFDSFTASNVNSIYDAAASPDEFILEFVANVLVDTDAPVTKEDAANVMAQSNFREYIGDFARQAEPVGFNEFLETHTVFFTGQGR